MNIKIFKLKYHRFLFYLPSFSTIWLGCDARIDYLVHLVQTVKTIKNESVAVLNVNNDELFLIVDGIGDWQLAARVE